MSSEVGSWEEVKFTWQYVELEQEEVIWAGIQYWGGSSKYKKFVLEIREMKHKVKSGRATR